MPRRMLTLAPELALRAHDRDVRMRVVGRGRRSG